MQNRFRRKGIEQKQLKEKKIKIICISQWNNKKKIDFQVVEGKHSVYRMSAATEEDKQEWIKCLTQSISHNPFHDILIQRKKKALTVS